MTEQPMTFCQIVLKQSLVDEVKHNPGHLDEEGSHMIRDRVQAHIEKHPTDPLPFPLGDFDPNVYTPFSEAYPWHTQIHRDAFGYGELPASLDQRLVVDLRFFGYIDPVESNAITWQRQRRDGFGMPQVHMGFHSMVHVATRLGSFVPGAEPQHLAPGLALHVCGVYRAGELGSKTVSEVKKPSVVDRYGCVWGLDNLYLGGCGILPVGNASNPTLTAACHALASARAIIRDLKGEGTGDSK